MKDKAMVFLPFEIICPLRGESSVLEVALKNGLELSHSCGGMGSCTTCRVVVEDSRSALPPRNELEADIAEMRGFSDNERLACQLPPSPGLVVRVPPSGAET